MITTGITHMAARAILTASTLPKGRGSFIRAPPELLALYTKRREPSRQLHDGLVKFRGLGKLRAFLPRDRVEFMKTRFGPDRRVEPLIVRRSPGREGTSSLSSGCGCNPTWPTLRKKRPETPAMNR